MAEEDEGEKQHEASGRKLEKAREQGDIARSPDLLSAASFSGFILAVLALGPSMLQGSGLAAQSFLEQVGQARFNASGVDLWSASFAVLRPLSPLVSLPLLLVVLTLFATKGIVFVPDKLLPKLSRVSLLANAKQKLGLQAWVAFLKNILKLVVVSLIFLYVLTVGIAPILDTQKMGAQQSAAFALSVLAQFSLWMALVFVVFGVIDHLWQVYDHAQKNRMSRKELTDEAKDSDGDPHQKAERRRRAQEIASQSITESVKTASVIIVNPTHYAVALRWVREDRRAPVCVAKGLDERALAIRLAAKESGVPIHSDPATARALYAVVEVGQEVRKDHYKAVAVAIRFAEAVRRKKRP